MHPNKHHVAPGSFRTFAFVSLLCGLFIAPVLSYAQSPEANKATVDMDTLLRSLDLDPPVDLDVDCPPLPPKAQQVLFAGVFLNSPPIQPGATEFPSAFCPPDTRFFARAEGRGNSSLFGEFVWSERYCAVPPGQIVAEGYFEGTEGGRLTWDALVRLDSIPPPIPFATFSGEFTFTGGTGVYDGVSGEAVVAAKQLGDAAPGRSAGSTAAAVCGWIAKK